MGVKSVSSEKSTTLFRSLFSKRFVPPVLIVTALSILTFCVYFPVIGHDFINLDDDLYVTANRNIQSGFTMESVRWAFTTLYAGFWHPLTWLSHILDFELYGLKPWGHHLSALILHILSSALLFLSFRYMTGAFLESSAIAFLFALHPLHVESVAWVAERKEVLGGLFWILSVYCYAYYVKNPSQLKRFFVFLVFFLGLTAKSMLVTLPFVFLLLDYWPLKRMRFPTNRFQLRSILPLICEKWPFFFLSLMFSVITFISEKRVGAVNSFESLDFASRCTNAVAAYCIYLIKLFWPLDLSVFYPHPGMRPVWQILGSLLVLSLISVLVVFLRKKRPYLLVGWLWYLGTLFPVIGIVQVGGHAYADRYTYVTLIGPFMMIAWGVKEVTDRFPIKNWGYAAFLVFLTVSSSLLTSHYLKYWQNSMTLFSRALEVTSNNYLAHNNLGAYLSNKRKDYKSAVREFEKALRIRPAYDDAHYNMGTALLHLGKISEAKAHLERAIALDPDNPQAHNNLGMIYSDGGQYDKAVEQFQTAIALDPFNPEVYNNLGLALARSDKYKKAIDAYLEALRLRPGFPGARNNLGVAYMDIGKYEEAVRQFQTGLSVESDRSADLHNNFGNTLLRMKEYRKAVFQYEEAIRIRPGFVEAHHNLGMAYEGLGRMDEAVENYASALQLNPKMAVARYNLARILYRIGRLKEADRELKRLQSISPELADALRRKLSNN